VRKTYDGDESCTYSESDDETAYSPCPDLNPHPLQQDLDPNLVGCIFLLCGGTGQTWRVNERRLGSRCGWIWAGETAGCHELFDEGEENGDDDGCFDGLAWGRLALRRSIKADVEEAMGKGRYDEEARNDSRKTMKKMGTLKRSRAMMGNGRALLGRTEVTKGSVTRS